MEKLGNFIQIQFSLFIEHQITTSQLKVLYIVRYKILHTYEENIFNYIELY